MAHRLLLADDSVTIQRVIELTFADEDVTVTAVGDGEQAIERIDADPPDIVLADVGMPKCDGYDVAAYVKSRPRLAHIPVVLLTGAFEPVDQARADAAGCDGVLAKPFEPQMVINRVKQLLGVEPSPAPRRSVPTASAVGVANSSVPHPAPAAAANPPPAPTPAVNPPSTPVVAANLAPPAAAVENLDPAAVEPSVPSIDASDPDTSLDDYFDQLDAAFAALEDADQAATAPPAEGTAEPQPVLDSGTEDEVDWSMPDVISKSRGDEDAGAASPTSDGTSSDDLDFYDVPGVEDRRGTPDAASTDLAQSTRSADSFVPEPSAPQIADAFASLFDAELSERVVESTGEPAEDAGEAADVAPPAVAPSSAGLSDAIEASAAVAPPVGTAIVSEELVAEVYRRVLARLTDEVLREIVEEVVGRTGRDGERGQMGEDRGR